MNLHLRVKRKKETKLGHENKSEWKNIKTLTIQFERVNTCKQAHNLFTYPDVSCSPLSDFLELPSDMTCASSYITCSIRLITFTTTSVMAIDTQ